MATDSTASPTIRWRKGELIGAGAYGRVYMGMNLDSGELLAVKQVLFAVNTNARDKAQVHVKELEEEVKVLRNLSHPNIVRYLGTAREEDALNIFLEFVPGGSIASLLGKFGSFPESVIRMYTRQLLQGLEYLHKNGIMHRDVKGANILVDNKGCIKLADFGASKQVVELATVSGAKSMKGTPYWMAPEVIRQTGHGLPADIWSVGCTVIEMATGKPPWSQQFQEVAALFHIGTTKSHPPIPDHLSQEANDFLLKCLEKEPNLRPTASELLCHPFVLKEISQCEKSCKSILTVSGFGEERPIRKSTTPLFANKSGMCSLLMQGSFRRIFGAKIPEQCSDSYMDDQNCSVRLESIQFDKESANMSEPSSFYPMQEPTSFNPMEEPTSFDPMQERSSSNSLCEPFEMKSGWGNKGFLTDQEDWQAKRVQKDDQKTTEFSFQCGTTDYNDDDDDDVTESKIKAFLDEKALELKRLQTPLFEEFHSIWNVSRQNETGEQLMVPLSPVVGRQFVMNNKSPSKGSSPSGPSFGRNSYSSETSISSGSPVPNARSNVMPLSEVPSPRVNEWKGLLEETQHLSPNPGVLNPTELQKLWKEELQQELEMKREEKRKLSRLVGSRSKSSSPNSKLSSPHETAVHRHSVSRLSFASPTQLPS